MDRTQIILYESFFNSSESDQLAILIHEHLHMTLDIVYDSSQTYTLDKSQVKYSTEMSENVISYYSDVTLNSTAESIATDLSTDPYPGSDSNFYTFNDPQKYLNEIAVLEREKGLCPNVSEKYRNERDAKIYEYKEKYRMVMTHIQTMN